MRKPQHSCTAFPFTDFLKIRLKFAVLFNRKQSTAAEWLQWAWTFKLYTDQPIEGRPPEINIISHRPNLHSVVIARPTLKVLVSSQQYITRVKEAAFNINKEVQLDTWPLSYSFLSFSFNYRATPRHLPLFICQFFIIYDLCTYNYMDFVPSNGHRTNMKPSQQ